MLIQTLELYTCHPKKENWVLWENILRAGRANREGRPKVPISDPKHFNPMWWEKMIIHLVREIVTYEEDARKEKRRKEYRKYGDVEMTPARWNRLCKKTGSKNFRF
jgi:hypothetical protein